MKKSAILVFIIISIVTFSTRAQYDVVKGKELIKKSSSKYKSYKTSKAEFQYTSESKADKTKMSLKGVFYLKGGRFRLKLGDQIVICDLKNVWTYFEEMNEVQINKYEPDALEINPQNLFTMWESGYLCGYAGEVTVKGKLYDLVELTPEDKSKPYFKVKLFLDKQTTNIQIVKIFEKNSTITTFEIKGFKHDIQLSESLFKFDASKHPGVEIIDLRD